MYFWVPHYQLLPHGLFQFKLSLKIFSALVIPILLGMVFWVKIFFVYEIADIHRSRIFCREEIDIKWLNTAVSMRIFVFHEEIAGFLWIWLWIIGNRIQGGVQLLITFFGWINGNDTLSHFLSAEILLHLLQFIHKLLFLLIYVIYHVLMLILLVFCTIWIFLLFSLRRILVLKKSGIAFYVGTLRISGRKRFAYLIICFHRLAYWFLRGDDPAAGRYFPLCWGLARNWQFWAIGKFWCPVLNKCQLSRWNWCFNFRRRIILIFLIPFSQIFKFLLFRNQLILHFWWIIWKLICLFRARIIFGLHIFLEV